MSGLPKGGPGFPQEHKLLLLCTLPSTLFSLPINPGTFCPLLCPRLVCSGVGVMPTAELSSVASLGIHNLWNGCLKGTGSAVLFMQTGFSDPEEDWHTARYLLENRDSPIRTTGQVML